MLLEDESGRVRIVGDKIDANSSLLVTGVVLAALGVETSQGDFEVLDYCYPGAPPQTPLASLGGAQQDMQVDAKEEWIALASGLNVGPASAASDVRLNLLVEYLLSEMGDSEEPGTTSSITHLILAGDSFAPLARNDPDQIETTMNDSSAAARANPNTAKRQAIDVAPFTPHPTQALAGHLADLSRVMSVHIIPGAADPAGAILPQQPLPRAMFGEAKDSEGFHTETNPCWMGVDGCE